MHFSRFTGSSTTLSMAGAPSLMSSTPEAPNSVLLPLQDLLPTRQKAAPRRELPSCPDPPWLLLPHQTPASHSKAQLPGGVWN